MARAKPCLLIRKGVDGAQERIPLSQDVVTLGRSDSCTIVVVAPTISRLHARIETHHDRSVIIDAGSVNGTFVNNQRIEHSFQLSTGDIIRLGTDETVFLFSDPEETLVVAATIQPEPLLIDDNARIVRVYDVAASLSPLEYDLLRYLAHNVGTVCTRESCYLAVWKQPYEQATCEDALNACIGKLRRNLRIAADTAEQDPPVITTIQRVGFRLDTPVSFLGRSDATPTPSQLSREINTLPRP